MSMDDSSSCSDDRREATEEERESAIIERCQRSEKAQKSIERQCELLPNCYLHVVNVLD